jgi:hypothetical protein
MQRETNPQVNAIQTLYLRFASVIGILRTAARCGGNEITMLYLPPSARSVRPFSGEL